MKDKVIIILSCLVITFFTVFFYNKKVNSLKSEITQIKQENLERVNKINSDYIKLQSEMKFKEKEEYERYEKLNKKNENLLADVASANRKLFIKTTSCNKSSSAGSTGMVDGSSERSVIDRSDAESIIRITKEADKEREKLRSLQNIIREYQSKVNKIEN